MIFEKEKNSSLLNNQFVVFLEIILYRTIQCPWFKHFKENDSDLNNQQSQKIPEVKQKTVKLKDYLMIIHLNTTKTRKTITSFKTNHLQAIA